MLQIRLVTLALGTLAGGQYFPLQLLLEKFFLQGALEASGVQILGPSLTVLVSVFLQALPGSMSGHC